MRNKGLSLPCTSSFAGTKRHTKSPALYTGATETEATPLAAPILGAAHIGNLMQLKNPILGLCQQSTFMLSAAKVDQCPR